MGVRFKFPAGGQVIRVPLTISIPNQRTITDLEDLELIITANDNLPLSLGVDVLCDSIFSIIKASDLVLPSLAISLDRMIAELKVKSENNVPAWIRIDEDIVEAIGMVLNAYQTDTDVLIDLVGSDVFENGMVIDAKDAVEISAAISPKIAQSAEMVLRACNNVEIGSVRQTLENLSNSIQIENGARVTLIGDLDPYQTGQLDPDKIPDITLVPVQPYLEVGIIEGGDGEISLAIRGSDDVRAIKTEPVKIAHIDPNTVGELDPDPVPDGRTV